MKMMKTMMMKRKKNKMNENEDNDEIITIPLEMEDGSVEECEVLTTLEYEGKDYIALLPLGKEEYYVFEVKFSDDEHIEIFTIESDKIRNKVIDEFDTIFASDDYYEDEDDDDEDE
jgi:hypothetical protein